MFFIAESQPLSIKSPSEHEHGKPITADKTQSKIHAQKRGGNEMCDENVLLFGK